ncbi:copper chaperone PCu(A)C [Streptomyces sp. SYSU K217416]
MPHARHRCRGRSALATVIVGLALVLSGCGSDEGFDPEEWNAPGQNARVGSVLIRYAHLAEPRAEPWKAGDDVPAYLWLVNEGSEPDTLLGASTPAAASVDLVQPDGKQLPEGLPLQPGRLYQLEPGKTHLVLRDVRQTIRGGDYVKVTVRFEKGGSATLNVPAQRPAYDESPSPLP